MTRVAVLIPVLGRPDRAALVADSVRASDARAEPLFLASLGDGYEIAACRAVGWTIVVDWIPGPGDYARKMNLGYEVARARGFEWVFLGADDVVFHGGWLDACLTEWGRSYACVIGTNDLGNARTRAGNHSTHTLVHRDYLECGGVVDDPTRLLCEGYDHQFVDDEFVQTAKSRDAYRHADRAWIEHLHPNWGKGEEDATYRKGQAHFEDDRALYEARKSMWLPQASAGGYQRRG